MKKVLTVFLSIVLILAMMPSMAFAADDGKLYCFYANGFTVDDDGYLTSDEVSDLIAVQSIVVGRAEILYFAIEDDNGYKVVNQVNYDDQDEGRVELAKLVDEEIEEQTELFLLRISKVDSYELSYTDDDKTYRLTMKCELPDVGCYSSDVASEAAFLINDVFDCRDNTCDANNKYSFYIVADGDIKSARFVKKYLENENGDPDDASMQDISGVTISTIDDKNNVRLVTVDKSVLAGNNQVICGDMVVEYVENNDSAEEDGTDNIYCSPFEFYIYGPNYNPEDDDDGSDAIEIYSDTDCTDRTGYISVNTSLAPQDNCFYIKSTKGAPVISKITTYYIENKSVGGKYEMIEYVGVFDGDKETYNKYTRDNEGEIILGEAYTPEVSPASLKEFVKIEPVDADNGIWKVAFQSYRGHERMTIEVMAGTKNDAVYDEIDIDYEVSMSYNEADLELVMPSYKYYYKHVFGNVDQFSDKEKVWDGLSGVSPSVSGDRCGSKMYIAMKTKSGYNVTDIKNAVDSSSLPYTIKEEYYYKVTDTDGKEIQLSYDGTNDLFVAAHYLTFDDDGAFCASRNIGSNNYSDKYGAFTVGEENVTEFEQFCEANNYTATKIDATTLIYTVFIPVDKQCEVKIITQEASSGGSSAIIAPPAADDDVKTDTDSTTSQTTTSTTIKDTKTETTKDENGNDVSKTTATVSDDIAGKLVDQAVSNKSDTVEITVKSDSGNKVDGENVELEIPKSAVKDIADKTDASLVINTDNGQVVLDNKTLETIASETEGDTVKIAINENTQLKESQKPAADVIGDNGYIFDLRVYIGDKLLHDFKGGKAHVTLPMPEKLDGKDVAVIYINDEGICEILNHTRETVGADKYIRFTTPHFSTYAIVESAAAEKLIKQQNQDKTNTLIKEAKLAASTSKTSKKNVKVTVKADKSLIKELKSMGYTVKYKYYRSTKKASKYTAVKTKTGNTYINTRGKKGTKYYYKAKILVYDGDTLVGQTALKQCSYGVRVWSK